MVILLLMAIETIAIIYFLIEIKRTNRTAAAEVALSKAWSNRFARQILEEKKEKYIKDNEKYHKVPEKKLAQKVKEWDKQIADYQKAEGAYLSGKRFSLLDMVSLFGYQILIDLKLDGENDVLRKLTSNCEHTGYVELERDQENGGKKNSAVYAYYLLASFIGFAYLGVIVALLLGVVAIYMGNDTMGIVLPMIVGLAGLALYGYFPYDNINQKAVKRQEEIDQSFPNAISKIALLVLAGMNITKAIEETAYGDDTLICKELRIALREMEKASTVQGAFTRLQYRCDNRYLDKVVALIVKSYTEGNLNLADDLKEINDDCWLDKKHNARRMGEKIQTKLFVPTMLMFIGILVVIVVPAMAGFNF